jgi:hypothetical protein
MNVLLIGGSNSVSVDGYIKWFSQHLFTITGCSANIVNIAVGGTTSFCGLSRLMEEKHIKCIDVVIYEYALNDTGHFNHRTDGELYASLALELLISTLANRFGNAIFVPVMLSSRDFFDMGTKNKVHEAHVEIYKVLDVQYVDIRDWFWRIFSNQLPDFIYADNAHYHRGAVVGLVGSLLAERVNALVQSRKSNVLNVLAKNLPNTKNYTGLSCYYMKAAELADFAFGPHEIAKTSNRHMSLESLRIFPGGGVRVNRLTAPFSLSVKSDIHHGPIEVTIDNKKLVICTRETLIKCHYRPFFGFFSLWECLGGD